MKVILQKDMKNLGKTGDVVKVRDGYGRNFLLPRGIAILADEKNKRVLAHQKRVAQSLAAKELAAAKALAEEIKNNTLEFKRETGDDGRLFGSVTSRDIAMALEEAGISVDRRKIDLENPLKELGRFEVKIALAHDVEGTISLFISAK